MIDGVARPARIVDAHVHCWDPANTEWYPYLSGGMKLDMPGEPAHPISTVGAGDVFMGTVIAGLAATNFYPAAIAAALRDAVVEGARATERWGALG